MADLRQLQLSDLDRIAALERELFGVGAWSHALLTQEVTGFGRWYVVAEVAATQDTAATAATETTPATTTGATPRTADAATTTAASLLVGYAGLWFDGDVSQVMTIGIDPVYQHRGIGRQLLAALIDHSILLGAEAVFLEVAVDNGPAIALYRSVGFLPIGVRKRYYQPGNRDAYTMRLQLG